MWVTMARIILRFRIAILVVLALLTGTMGYFATKVELSYEYASLLPKTDSSWIRYSQFQQQYGEDANTMIIGISDPDFFQKDKFNDFLSLSDSISGCYGVESCVSIASAYYLHRNSQARKFEPRRFFDSPVATQAELDNLSDTLMSLPFYKGRLYSSDNNVFLIAVAINKPLLDSKEREDIIDNIVMHTEAFSAKYGVDAHYSGLPYVRTKTSLKLKKELTMFIFLAGLITASILFLFFRSIKVVAFCMMVVSVGVIWVMGWMGLFNFHVTILSSLIPPLIIVIGVPNCVFLLNKYHSEFLLHGNKIKALQRVIRKIGNATFLTNLTTASGFATFIVTSSSILKEFGTVAFLGIMGVFVFSITLIPIVFSFLNPPSEKQVEHLENRYIEFFVEWFIKVCSNFRTRLYIIASVLFVLALAGVSIMTSTGYIVDDLPHDDPIYTDLKFFEKHFNGVMPLEITIDTKKPRGALSLPNLRKMDKLYKALEKYPELSAPLSVLDVVKFYRQAYYNGSAAHYAIPNSLDRNFILAYVANESNPVKNAIMDSLMQTARVSLKVEDVGTARMKELEQLILADLDDIFSESGTETVITGSSMIFFKGTHYLTTSLVTSLLLAILLIAVFMAWMFASLRMVIVALIPNFFPLLLTAALMGYLGIPIKPSTILVFSIAFGISVDDTIHFLAKYRQELKSSDWNIGVSVVKALRETGFSMIYTSIVLFFGFGIFMLSQFGGTVALGALVSFTLLVAMLSNLLLLPSLLLTLEKNITNKSFKEPLMQIYNEEIDIELDDLKIESNSSGQ
jgi:uncharacterized protein